MVVPSVRIVPRNHDRRILPERALHDRVDRIHNKNLLVNRTRISRVPVLICAGLQVRHRWHPPFIHRRKKIRQVVLVIRPVRARPDQQGTARPRVMNVRRLWVIHERLVVRNIVARIYHRVVAR